ncbi:hypothetical protein ES705_32515 [subsurface metagenome]
MEKPKWHRKGAKEWFNPIIITPDNLKVLEEINQFQLAGEIAYRTYIAKSNLVQAKVDRAISNLLADRDSGRLANISTNFLRLMQR